MKKYTSKEMAEILGVNIQVLRRWNRNGKLKAYRLVDGGKLYYTDDHLKYIKNRENINIGSDNDGK